MGTVEPRGKKHRAKVRKDGVALSETFNTKAAAWAWVHETERKVASGQKHVFDKRTLGDLLERYAEEVSPKKKGVKWEQTRIQWFLRQKIAGTRLSDLSSSALAAWRDSRLKQVSGETIRRDVALLSHALSVAKKEWNWLDENPLSNVSRPKGNPGRERIATDEEIERLCHVADYVVGRPAGTATARTAAAFVFAIETGCRGGEVCSITPESVRNRTVRLAQTKNGDGRVVALSARAQQVLRDVDGNFGVTVRQKDALFRKVREKAGIEGLNFHDSRHTAITRLARKLNPLELARMVGHRDLSMLLRYYNESAEEIAKRL